MVRYDSVRIDFTPPFTRNNDCHLTIELTAADQTDPRLLALLDWMRDRQAAQIAAEGGADPTLLA